MLKRDNQSEKHLVVGSLEVLGDISNSGIRTIRRTVSELEGAQTTMRQKQEDYWSAIASDEIVTALEKKELKREWNSIVQVYAAINKEVEGGFLESTGEWKAYALAYSSLYDYLFKTLKLFDDMTADTRIPDTDYFISQFNAYYSALEAMRLAITNGKIEETKTEIYENRPYTPQYRGVYYLTDKIAEDVKAGKIRHEDWFMWGGETIENTAVTQSKKLQKSYLYMAIIVDGKITFTVLDAKDLTYSKQFMAALTDILSSQDAGDGYFSTVFAQALFANSAAIAELQTKIITLTQDSEGGGGIIRSGNFLDKQGNKTGLGWQIDYDGNVEFNNGYFSGKLNCGNLIIGDKTFSIPVKEFSTSQGADFFSYITSKFGVTQTQQTDQTKGVKSLFNSATSVLCNNQTLTDIRLYNSGEYYGSHTRKVYAITGTGNSFLIYQDIESDIIEDGESTNVKKMYYSFTQLETYIKALCFQLYNLPETKPDENGVVWKDSSGYLRLS